LKYLHAKNVFYAFIMVPFSLLHLSFAYLEYKGIRKANQVSQHNLKNMHDNKHYRLMYFAHAILVDVHTCIIVYDGNSSL